MQVILIKYIQVFCFALFFSNKIKCDKMLLDELEEDHKIFQISACAAHCLETYQNVTLENCYHLCKDNIETDAPNIKQIHESLNIRLLCRGDTNLVLEIVESEYEKDKANNTTDTDMHRGTKIYVFKVSIANVDPFPMTREIYLTDSRIIEIQNLTASTLYNISAIVVYASNEFSVVAKRLQFSTLERFYKPDKIFDISISQYEESEHNAKHLSALMTWKPANDRTCFYEILYYATATGNTFGIMQDEVSVPKTLYTYKLKNLSLGTGYQIGIRGKNLKETSKESDIFWYNLKTPTCLEWFQNDLKICRPPKPEGLNATEKYIGVNKYSINITWKKPTIDPDYYILKIIDLNLMHINNPRSFRYRILKDQTTFFIPEILLYGIQYEVHLIAFSAAGNSSTLVICAPGRPIELEEYRHLKLTIVIVAPIFSIAFIAVIIVIICQRRAKFKRYQERCRYFEDLDKKAPVDTNSNFGISTKALSMKSPTEELSRLQQELEERLFIDDELEVSRSDVQLFEVLGEGAFGLVKRGIFKVNETTNMAVAVKMLKEHPSSDDITAFRREIDVLKAVGKHPNIVGIVGHCTKNINDLLLLTEFCSLGNLLNFLRSEWKYLNKIIQPRNCNITMKSGASQNQGDEDTSSTEQTLLEYKNIDNNKNNLIESCRSSNPTKSKPPTKLVVNNSYDLSVTCTNACKCQVDIVSNKCLNSNDLKSEVNLCEVKIQNCECNSHLTCDHSGETLFIENKSYYKLLPNEEQSALIASTDRQPLKSIDLIHIAKQIAMGMEYLSRNKVVHRDLAARNILVCQDRTVKIADFGLSRDVYQENIYKKTGNGKLPIKWLALESMTHQVYTTQSDVWSYGILLYEIVTLGGTPYPLIPTNRLLKLLKTGYRMEKPRNCGQELYNLMLSCWHVNPNDRPNFSSICESLDRLMINSPYRSMINLNFEEHNKVTRSWSEESYLKPI